MNINEPKYTIGDEVTVIDNMLCYPLYEQFAIEREFKLTQTTVMDCFSKGIIFRIGYEDSSDCYLYAIAIGDKNYIIQEDGLALGVIEPLNNSLEILREIMDDIYSDDFEPHTVGTKLFELFKKPLY